MERLVYGCIPRLMRRCYEDLYLVDFYPDIKTCDKTVCRLVSMPGTGRETQMKHFMKMFVSDQSMVLIDGTSIFTGNSYPALRKGIILSMTRTGRCGFCDFLIREDMHHLLLDGTRKHS